MTPQEQARNVLRHLRRAATALDRFEHAADICIRSFGVVTPLQAVRKADEYREQIKREIPEVLALFHRQGWAVPNPRWIAPDWLGG